MHEHLKETPPSFAEVFSSFLFLHRGKVLSLFGALSCVMLFLAFQIAPDASYEKWLPLEHPYMKTFLRHQKEFGGANKILIALVQEKKEKKAPEDIFNPAFFRKLKGVTDELFFLPGIERGSLTSLYTPNVRYIEVTEGGFRGGNIIPSGFTPSPAGLKNVKENLLKSNYVGRLVSEDFSAALVQGEFAEHNPEAGKKLDYAEVTRALEHIRSKYEGDGVRICIIGFSELVGNIMKATENIILFFGITVLFLALLLYGYTGSFRITSASLCSSLLSIIWLFGVLVLLGYGIDPMSVLIPFLIFAIGMSHSVQMVNTVRHEVLSGLSPVDASRRSLALLLLPGGVALLSDSVGFLISLMVKVEIIQEMALTASIGVALLLLTNLFILPLLLSYIPAEKHRVLHFNALWKILSRCAKRKQAVLFLFITLFLFAAGGWKGSSFQVGDLKPGVPELREDSRFNQDVREITSRFSFGIDTFTVYAETVADGCVHYDIMKAVESFSWEMRQLNGVHSVLSLPDIARRIQVEWNEGNLKWESLPRNRWSLGQAVSPVETSSGLLNFDCSVLPVYIFPEDHTGETLERIAEKVKEVKKELETADLHFRLAGGNAGVMAATNATVRATQAPVFLLLFGVIFLLCLLSFRSLRGTVIVLVPLLLVSVLAYALMSVLHIGLKVSTLPVLALGVGIGVDYGIYMFVQLQHCLKRGMPLQYAYHHTLVRTGNAVLFTGLTLSFGVAGWFFSDLQFQSDMGVLLAFMFFMNMLGALFLLPALAFFLFPSKKETSCN